LAALALAKLHQSTSRPFEAHAVLAPALEGFSPTPEMPEIAEAEALLAALAETATVKADAARRERRAQVQAGMATALLQGKGMYAPETRAAFDRADEIGAKAADPMERLAILYGLWAVELAHGDARKMLEIAKSMAPVAERDSSGQGRVVARRVLGLSQFYAGDFAGSEANMQWAADHYDFDRDRTLAIRFAHDQGVTARHFLAFAKWVLGDVEAGLRLIGEAKCLAERVDHPPTSAGTYGIAAWLDNVRGDHNRARENADKTLALSSDFGLPFWRSCAEFWVAWARAASEGTRAAWDEAEAALNALSEHGAGLEPSAAYIAAGYAGLGDFDRALALVDRALSGPVERGLRALLPEANRVRGDILLKREPANPAPAEEAFQTAIAVAKEQGARSFELRTALSLAKLYHSTARPADAHAVLAPALEGFSPTPEMPEIAEAQALLATLADTNEVKAAIAQRQRRLDLQTSYGQALMWTKGFVAEETEAAFARVSDLAGRTENAPARFVAYYGRCLRSIMRGEYRQAREIAETFLQDAEVNAHATEAGVARRMLGFVLLNQGDLKGARSVLARALDDCIPERDAGARFLFSTDTEVSAAAYLALVEWHLGEVESARRSIDRAIRRSDELGHVAAVADALRWKTGLECRRNDASATRVAADALLKLAEGHGIKTYADIGQMYANWALGRMADPEAGAVGLRAALADFVAQGNRGGAPGYHGLLAEIEATIRGPDSALAVIDQGLAIADETGGHFTDPYLHRLRGEFLLKRNPANPAPAEEAYQTAIAIAKQQGARTFALQAALPLAKLYQSTGRPIDAHAVLSDALEGFAPTPEMPEIAEAEALLAALEEMDEVRADVARRRRMAQLQVSYGNALIAARGYGAPETTDAFAAARERVQSDSGAPERLAADYGLWVGGYTRGELPSMRAHAAAFLADVEARPDSPEAGVAHRVQGTTHWFAGEYVEARRHLERALALFAPGRDDELAFRFGNDAGVAAMSGLAFVSWPVGEIDRAVWLVDRLNERIANLTHVNTLALGAMRAALLALMRADRRRARTNASELVRIVREHDLPMFRAFCEFLEGWATADAGSLADGLEIMRRGVRSLREQNVLLFDGLFKIALAEAEFRAGDIGGALMILDEALVTCERTGQRTFEAELHRARGEMLLMRNPANQALAEEALQTAIAVAKKQGTRSFELRAALALAKLYQSTARTADAHAVLAPALEGFAATPEMPEIAEAEALLATLDNDGFSVAVGLSPRS
jgi:predicted ATPase